jgi:hypothetical protein
MYLGYLFEMTKVKNLKSKQQVGCLVKFIFQISMVLGKKK